MTDGRPYRFSFVSSSATITAQIPAVSLPTINGSSIDGAKPAAKPKWSPKTKAADTAKAIFTIFPRSSISFKRPKVAMELARLATSPPAAVSLTPSHFPRCIRGFRSSRVATYTRGKAPASTMAMVPTVSKPSEIGAIPGMMAKPVRLSKIAAANARVMRMVMV